MRSMSWKDHARTVSRWLSSAARYWAQGVHQTDTDRQFICLITCSDKQTVPQSLHNQTRHVLSCLQTFCKQWLGISMNICVVMFLTQTLTLLGCAWDGSVCDLRDQSPPAVTYILSRQRVDAQISRPPL